MTDECSVAVIISMAFIAVFSGCAFRRRLNTVHSRVISEITWEVVVILRVAAQRSWEADIGLDTVQIIYNLRCQCPCPHSPLNAINL